MQASKHPEYKEENKWLENTQKAIDASAGISIHRSDGGKR
jgi:hypothetical protein